MMTGLVIGASFSPWAEARWPVRERLISRHIVSLAEASAVHKLFEGRKTTGKLVLVFNADLAWLRVPRLRRPQRYHRMAARWENESKLAANETMVVTGLDLNGELH